jgi:hypothetical protein
MSHHYEEKREKALGPSIYHLCFQEDGHNHHVIISLFVGVSRFLEPQPPKQMSLQTSKNMLSSSATSSSTSFV